MKPCIILLCSIIVLSPINEAFATLIAPLPLEDAVKESPWIFHVKVLKKEEPFEAEGNENIYLVYCKVLSVLKDSFSSRKTILPAKFEGDFGYLIVSLAMISGIDSYMSTGNEYVIFCNTSGLTPTVVGGNRIYQVKDGMVSAWAMDFPDPKLTEAEIEALKKDPAYRAKRRKVPLKTFLERVKELQKSTSK